jgi:hypothetical protein
MQSFKLCPLETWRKKLFFSWSINKFKNPLFTMQFIVAWSLLIFCAGREIVTLKFCLIKLWKPHLVCSPFTISLVRLHILDIKNT